MYNKETGKIENQISVNDFKKYVMESIVEFAYSKCQFKDLTINIKYDLNSVNKTYKDVKRILVGKTPLQLKWDIEGLLRQLPEYCKIFWLSIYWSEMVHTKQQFKEKVFIEAK